MRILLTGGAGYIGSHTLLALVAEGHDVHVIDNYANSSPAVFDRLKVLAQGAPFTHEEADIRDRPALDAVCDRFRPEGVIHFAGLKAVGESAEKPLEYYDNNVNGSVQLLSALARAGCRRIVFSSSATVYGDPQFLPLTEAHPLSATNPYGRTKLQIEDILRDLAAGDPDWRIALLRYFNPVGAHPSGMIGEDPADIPNNLMPFITQVAVGKRPALSVFGDDYDTPDGTGVRDYIHIMDLARAHVAALTWTGENTGCRPFNVGTGDGFSVLQMISAFEAASGRPIPYRITDRRPGDIAACYADTTRAREELNWTARETLADMCASAWKWQSANPDGYDAP